MVEWHTYDAWRFDAVAQGRLHDWLNLVGGGPVLPLVGRRLPGADGARERKGVPSPIRRREALARALWLLGVAYLFRLSIWVVDGGWHTVDGIRGVAAAFVLDVLKVDILNVIAVALLLSARRGGERDGRLDLCRGWSGLLCAPRTGGGRKRAGGLSSCRVRVERQGIVLCMTAVLQFVPPAADRALGWLSTMGRHSLLGDIVSLMLPYGSVSHLLHRQLSMRAALGAVVAMIVLIWAASSLADRLQARKAIRPPAATSAH
jgi:hypothetical protein